MAEPFVGPESEAAAPTGRGRDELRGGAGRARGHRPEARARPARPRELDPGLRARARRCAQHCADKLRQVQLRVEKLTLDREGNAEAAAVRGGLSVAGLAQAMAAVAAAVEAELDGPAAARRTAPQARLHEAMRYAVLGGGKRLRPFLVAATAELFGVRGRAATRARCRDRADPRLLAGPRRPAGDGRRRAAPRPADLPPRLRRGDGDPRRRRAAGAGVRGAGAAGLRRRTPSSAARWCAGLAARRRRARHVRRAAARSAGRAAGAGHSADDRDACSGSRPAP